MRNKLFAGKHHPIDIIIIIIIFIINGALFKLKKKKILIRQWNISSSEMMPVFLQGYFHVPIFDFSTAPESIFGLYRNNIEPTIHIAQMCYLRLRQKRGFQFRVVRTPDTPNHDYSLVIKFTISCFAKN